jgi:hypothetical protein
MSDFDFDPDDVSEIEKIFAKIEKDNDYGYVVELHITRLAAQEMVDEWLEAIMGHPPAIRNCMTNYSFIVQEVMNELKTDTD